MKNNQPQEEVLLIISSKLIRQDLCKSDCDEELSPAEKLEEACWNGMLKEWSWGSIPGNGRTEGLFLWKIFIADRIICARLSETPQEIDKAKSLDPYLFVNSVKDYYN